YKKRKTIALRKLENERLNMSRVKDILSELGRQVGPLRRQSEAADKYVRFRDELKKYDINLFLYENGETKTKIRELVEKERIASEDLERSKAEYEVAKEEYEKLSETIHQLDEEISSIRTKISQGDIVKESMLGQIKVYEEQINSANEAESRYRERHEEITEAIQKAEEDKAALTKDKADNQEALTKALSAANDQDSKVLMVQNESEEIRQEIEKKKERLIELVNAKGTINARRERLETMMEQMIKRREELTQDLEKSESDRTAQEEKVKSLEKEFQEAKEQESSLTEDVQARENDLREADQDIARLNRELGDAKTQYTANEARLDSLRNITERYEGYGSSIREVMKLKEKKTGIHGVVADIIKVDKKYEIAIETALGGNIQNIVTDTEATAKDAIAYLKANKFGRATFLPLKAVTGREEFRNEAVLSEHGVLGLASSLVNVEERYEGVARYLLGRIVVADNIDNALALARKYNYSLIIVTLEGELLNRGGSLTGGAFKNKSNLLSRRREIEELENSLKELTQKQEAYAKDIDMVTLRKENLDKEIADLRALLQESRIYLNTIKINLDAANARKEEIQGTFENINKENAQIEEQTGSIQNENTSLDSELDSNQKENESIKEEILALEEKQVKLREQETAELLIAQNMRVDHSRLVEQNSFLTNSIIRLENEIEKLNNDKTTLETNRTASIRGMDEKREEIEKIRQTLEQAEVDKKELLAHLDEVEAAKEEQTGSHKGFIDKREEYSERIADLDKEVFRLNSSREKLEERFENRSSYIWDEYELTYNNALPLRDESLTDVKEMRDKINELKASIRGLGVINVGAIDEYKEVKERYDFLTNQYQDLQKAEADLVKIIRDLDKQMRTQFNTEFKKIRAEFSKVFKEMFGGGTGSIELEEDVDVLDAGISIIAQPPGKKLQNMLQLSGGEKALTAIAVLFAIQNLKPSPFCILDEIEAALDDANITRFAEYLHKLSNEVQFIVITHRRGTMEAADRLYGITMQEKGVSTLISVDLSDIKDEDIAS
ncbi:MAG: chromosome segregation protein SMC, partial [Lachnospiraceae bacterium]|nr:chromosome segregation protein SMC [Lachnospiraceae bacterium]